MSWQGQPAVIRSTGGTAAQSRAVMSPRFGHPGVACGQDGGGVPVGLGAPGQPGTLWGARTSAEHLTWASILGGRALPPRLSAHGPVVRLARAPCPMRRLQVRGDLGTAA